MVFLTLFLTCIHNHLSDTHNNFEIKKDMICICYEVFEFNALKINM